MNLCFCSSFHSSPRWYSWSGCNVRLRNDSSNVCTLYSSSFNSDSIDYPPVVLPTRAPGLGSGMTTDFHAHKLIRRRGPSGVHANPSRRPDKAGQIVSTTLPKLKRFHRISRAELQWHSPYTPPSPTRGEGQLWGTVNQVPSTRA